MGENTLASLPIGTTVHERYEVVSIVGRGGLGTVYCVRDIIFGKQNIYALKELADQSRSARRQFEHEAQWLQALDHNHIPKVREYFEWRSRLYLVMDFVDGENLEQKLYRQGGQPLPEEQVIAWILPICDALQYLHTRTPSILHRDVKPANIIVTPAGHPVLVDLGIAKEHLPGANRTATFVRKAGTEGYAPPEQYTVAGKSGPWSDVYALGATLYHLLTNQVPPTAIDRVTMEPDLTQPSFYNRSISPQTNVAIYRAMAMRPSERYQTVAQFAAALSGSVAPPESPISGPSRVSKPSSPSVPSFGPGPEGYRAPPTPPTATSPRLSPSAPDDPSLPFTRSGPGGAPGSPYGAPYTPPRTPSQPPARHPSFAGSRPPNAANMSDLDVALPPLPPELPSIAASMRQTIEPSPQNSPPATAARFERIRASVIGGDKSRKAARNERGVRWPWLTGIILAVILIVVGVATAIIWPRLAPVDRSSPQASITGYFNALQQGDTGRAWQYVTASRIDTGSQATFSQNLNSDDARYGRVISIHIVTVENDSATHATATVQATRANEPQSPIAYSISLSQYDGTTWLIDSVTNQ